MTPRRFDDRNCAFSRRCSVQPRSLPSCTIPIAAWMSVMRLLRPTTSFLVARLHPLIAQQPHGPGHRGSAVVTMPPSPDVMFFVG